MDIDDDEYRPPQEAPNSPVLNQPVIIDDEANEKGSGSDEREHTPRRLLTRRRSSRMPSRERNRPRSRSRVQNLKDREEELEAEKQRLEILNHQLERERELYALRERERRRESELRSSRRSLPRDITETPRYESTSVFFEELLKVFKTRDRDSFPNLNENVIPIFDPMVKEQPIATWLSKVDECSEIYKWSDTQIIHYALPKLRGHAKTWYQGLPSIKRTWPEWKILLTKSFPSTENYAELLTEMLNKRVKFGESLEAYYYSKINLLNRCKISGKDAVDCVIHGVDDRNVKVGAQAARFGTPEDVLEFFKTVKVQPRDNKPEVKKHNRTFTHTSVANNSNPINKVNGNADQSKPLKSMDNITCFNCKAVGHPSFRCPKPIVKCSYCHLIGHVIGECPKKSLKPDSAEKSVLRVQMGGVPDIASVTKLLTKNSNENDPGDDTSNKYKLLIKINQSPIACQVDLGSEATLIRKSDAQKLGLIWSAVDGPLLRGLGNVPYLPLGRLHGTIDVHGVVEKDVEILVIDDHLINYPVLLGHTFTERPLVRIIKSNSDLIFEKANESSDRKVMLKTTDDVVIDSGGIKAVHVNTDDQFSGNIYVGGSVRGTASSEYYLLPGEYEVDEGSCLILIQSLCTDPISLPKGFLITRARYVGTGRQILNVVVGHDTPESPVVKFGDHLTNIEQERLLKLLEHRKHCFSTGLHDLGFTTEGEMVIQLKDSDPVVYRPYRLSHSERNQVQSMVDEMVQNGIVRESNSPYASPIVLVQKKTGDKRLCVDYRALNRKTSRDHYPLPRIEDLLDQLSGHTVFTTLDLASGYYQIPIAEESKEKTAFVTPDGQYEYNRMPFGLANAPAVFQRVMHKVLAKAKYVVIYMDDILIPAKSFNEGMSRLEEVLTLLESSGLTLKMEKCKFFKDTIDFLGFEISKDGVKPGLLKIEAVAKFPTPRNQHDVRRFIGLASFFRRFVKNFALIARPLTNLLKKDTTWRWSAAEKQAFADLKRHLVERPVLALYDHSAETQLHTDASKMGLAGILLQRRGSDPWKPVAYYSRQTTADEQKLHSFELETLAVVSALGKFRVYLLGTKFTIVTDCNALRSTFTKRDLVTRISRWWIQFLEYDCDIEYRAGSKMSHVDALSRSPVCDEVHPTHVLDILSVTKEDWITTVQASDPEIKNVKDTLVDPETAKIAGVFKDYKVKNGRVFRIIDQNTLRWVVPRGVRWQLLKANHDDVGHFGFEKTLLRLQAYYWFPKMRRFTKKYVGACLECAHHKIPSGVKEGELHPIPKIEIPFHTIHADHLGPFTRSKRKNVYLLVIVDGFTKYVNLTPVRSTKSKASIKVFKNFFSYFGTPTRLITDRGTSFTSKRFQTFVKTLGVKHILNSVATPRANGQVERYNRTILAALGAMAHGKNPEKWDELVPDVQLGINSTAHETTKKTPTELLFGYKVTNPSQAILKDVINDLGEENARQTLDEIRCEAGNLITKSQERDKIRFDKSRKTCTKYTEGDLVRIIRVIVPGHGQSKKLESKCQGPYRIKKILPNDRFVVEDTPLTRKGKRYEGVVSADKIFPWLSFDNDPTDPISSDDGMSE